MKHHDIKQEMRVLIRTKTGTRAWDEYEVMEYDGEKWLVRNVKTGTISRRDGRALRLIE